MAPNLDNGKQLARVRRICASIAGTIEKISHGEPTFFTPKRVFAMFANNHHGDGRVAVWLPAAAGVQTALIAEAPEIYFRPPYVGPSGWVGVELSKVDDEQLGALIREAFRFIDRKSAASKRSKAPPRREKPMPQDNALLDRVRVALGNVAGVEEKKMFGGITFMVRGKMCISVSRGRIMCRIDPAVHDSALEHKGCRTVLMKGRQYRGYVYVDADALIAQRDLDYWLGLALDYNGRAKAARSK